MHDKMSKLSISMFISRSAIYIHLQRNRIHFYLEGGHENWEQSKSHKTGGQISEDQCIHALSGQNKQLTVNHRTQ